MDEDYQNVDVAKSAFLMETWFYMQKQELLAWYLDPNANAEIRVCYEIVEAAREAADDTIRAKKFDFTFEPHFYKRNFDSNCGWHKMPKGQKTEEHPANGAFMKGNSDK